MMLLFSVVAMSIIYFYFLTFFNVINFEPYQILIYSLIAAPMFTLIYLYFTERYQEPYSYHVAIVGFPKSGKTTLIISLFGEAFAQRLPIRMVPKGTQTIDLVNLSLSMLEKGQSLGPTKDQDRFSFRGEVTMKYAFLSKKYNLEFGDFPGHDSQKYVEDFGPWLHKTEYFKWVSSSDAIIFVIDLGHYLNLKKRSGYIAEISSAIRAAWQYFIDVNEYRLKQVKNIPIILAFNKADLFSLDIRDYRTEPEYLNEIEEKIMEMGFGNKIPELTEIYHNNLIKGKSDVINDFENLITYLENETSNMHIIFTSSFGLYHGVRLGLKELFTEVLPS